MNFPLKYLENHLSENWLLAGEALLEDGAVSGLTELERHLWIARVDDAEVEIQITPARVKAFSCDCIQYKKEKGCGHLAAALLALRKRLEQKQEAKEKIKLVQKPKRLTIPGLLQHISPEELLDFVQGYAAQNRPFALALKARFTSALPIEGKREKYLELLDSAIKEVRGKDDKVSSRGAQQLARFGWELLGQAEDSIAEKHPRDAGILLTSILEKIGPISRKTEGKSDKLLNVLQEAFSLLKQILHMNPAPELLQELWDFCLRESKKFNYRQSSIQLNYFHFLKQSAPALGKAEELLDFFHSRLADMEAADPNRAELLILTHQLLSSQGDTQGVQDHLLDHLHEPAFILYVVEEAIATGHWKKARFLAEKTLESVPTNPQTARLEEHLFQLALRENDRDAIVHFGAFRFLQSKDPSYLSHLKENAGASWPALAEQLLRQLEDLPYSLLKRDAIASLLFTEGRFDELAEYILRLQSIDLLVQYGRHWPPEREEQAESLHLSILRAYLSNHLGRKPSQRVREALESLFDAGMGHIAERLLAGFRKDYAARPSLMEELETLPS